MRMKTPSASSAWRMALARSGPPTSMVRKLVAEGRGSRPAIGDEPGVVGPALLDRAPHAQDEARIVEGGDGGGLGESG